MQTRYRWHYFRQDFSEEKRECLAQRLQVVTNCKKALKTCYI